MEKVQNLTLEPQNPTEYVTQTDVTYEVKVNQLHFSNCVIRSAILQFPIYLRTEVNVPERLSYVFEDTVLEDCTLQFLYPCEIHFKNCTMKGKVRIYYTSLFGIHCYDGLIATPDTILHLYKEHSNEDTSNNEPVRFIFENCTVENELVDKLVTDYSVISKYREQETNRPIEIEFGI